MVTPYIVAEYLFWPKNTLSYFYRTSTHIISCKKKRPFFEVKLHNTKRAVSQHFWILWNPPPLVIVAIENNSCLLFGWTLRGVSYCALVSKITSKLSSLLRPLKASWGRVPDWACASRKASKTSLPFHMLITKMTTQMLSSRLMICLPSTSHLQAFQPRYQDVSVFGRALQR